MSEENLKIAEKIMEGNNKIEGGYCEGIYKVLSAIRVSIAALECKDNGMADELFIADVQRVLNMAKENITGGTTGELLDLLCMITD